MFSFISAEQKYQIFHFSLSSQGYGFSSSHVWMWSWTIKKGEHWRIDTFELWCWRRLLRVPWTARRSSQSILKISATCSLEGLTLKLKLQYFGHMMQRTDSFEKTLMLGKTEGRRRRGQQRMRWLDGITNSMDMSWVNSRSWWWTGRPAVLQSMGLQRVGHDWVIELNSESLFIFQFYRWEKWDTERLSGWPMSLRFMPLSKACPNGHYATMVTLNKILKLGTEIIYPHCSDRHI